MPRKPQKTKSEGLFEDFCNAAGIPWSRVHEASDQHQSRPDYEISLAGVRVVVEVKQFDPNAEEADSARQLEARGYGSVVGGTPGARVRQALVGAAPQLKALSEGECPTILVVYNNSGCGIHDDPYAVATAMQGLDVVPVLVPADPAIAPTFLDARSGPKRKMTADHNTTISAIGVLRSARGGKLYLDLHHNRHAKNPIQPDWARMPSVSHLRLDASAASSLGGWLLA